VRAYVQNILICINNLNSTLEIMLKVLVPLSSYFTALKGYISKKLTIDLLDNGVDLVTNVRKNMKAKALMWTPPCQQQKMLFKEINACLCASSI
jgi:hypothetical protein